MRKFLKGLELPEDTIDSIMARYGELVTKDKEKITELTDKVKEFDGIDIEAIKKEQFELGKTESSKELEDFKKQISLEKALSKYKAKDANILSKMLDAEKVKYNDKFEIVEGLEEQVNSLKTSHDYLFESDKPLPEFTTEQTTSSKMPNEKVSYKDLCSLYPN